MNSIWKKLGWMLIFPMAAPVAVWGDGIPYSVQFEGIDDPKALKSLRSLSQLVALKKKEPSSLNALRFRAESDVPQLIKALHALGYFEAQIDIHIQQDYFDYCVIVQVHPGPLYLIESFSIELKSAGAPPIVSPEEVEQEALCLHGGDPADTQKIIDSELSALHFLSEKGYPLATTEDRKIIADGKTKTVTVLLVLDTGPLAHFGATSIEGNTSVRAKLIEKKRAWQQGDLYNSACVEQMQQALMDTCLFSSAFITHGKALNEEGELPLTIEVAETKHKSISLGASYQTTFGGGASLGWENRNVQGLGRRFSLQVDIAQRSHSGVLSYLIPDLDQEGQSFTILAQATHETIKPYHVQSYNFLNRFDWQVNCIFFFSVGAMIEYLIVTNSVDNGHFLLAEAPLHFRWTNVQDFLDPTEGVRIDYRAVPSLNLQHSSEYYYRQMLSLATYLPLWRKDRLILAQRIVIGSIFSNGLNSVPVPKRFFGGSEEYLRGYKYYTVSPLTEDDKPIGGRSAVFYSLEPRFRIGECFGIVPFFDLGNVYLEQLPTWKGKWFKSVGIGLRYYSFLGPLRVDLAFPLDRREGIDPHWWIFVSLGQTF